MALIFNQTLCPLPIQFFLLPVNMYLKCNIIESHNIFSSHIGVSSELTLTLPVFDSALKITKFGPIMM